MQDILQFTIYCTHIKTGEKCAICEPRIKTLEVAALFCAIHNRAQENYKNEYRYSVETNPAQ